MSRVIKTTGCQIFSTDLYERGYGEAGHDFLISSRCADNIVTNPPYNCAEGFVASGIKHARHKFALLLRLAFLEGANRANTIFAMTPPSRVWVFSERITFYPKGAEVRGSGTTAYAWFVWDKDACGTTELKWFKPGYRARYSSDLGPLDAGPPRPAAGREDKRPRRRPQRHPGAGGTNQGQTINRRMKNRGEAPGSLRLRSAVTRGFAGGFVDRIWLMRRKYR
jgi:hypothetical protein